MSLKIILFIIVSLVSITKQFMISAEYADNQSSITNRPNHQCDGQRRCVPFHQCDNGTSETPHIDTRFNRNSECDHYLEVCCNVNNIQPKIGTRFYLSEKTVNSCGRRNKHGVSFTLAENSENFAEYGEFPWMVAILELELPTGSLNYKCGGSLIAANIVLTAAHCVRKVDIINLVIRAGEWDTKTTNEPFKHSDNYVYDMIIHEHFDAKSFENDIALLFLKNKFVISDVINTICLPYQNQRYDYKRCFVSGWGKDVFDRYGSNQAILKKVELPTVSFSKCQELMLNTKLFNDFQLHHSSMCAGGEEGKDACKGDGGSPLVCPIDGKPGFYYQAGIVSWGISCGMKNIPGVYTDVANFRSWIDDKISEKIFFLHN